jgi:hypothetical protein
MKKTKKTTKASPPLDEAGRALLNAYHATAEADSVAEERARRQALVKECRQAAEEAQKALQKAGMEHTEGTVSWKDGLEPSEEVLRKTAPERLEKALKAAQEARAAMDEAYDDLARINEISLEVETKAHHAWRRLGRLRLEHLFNP